MKLPDYCLRRAIRSPRRLVLRRCEAVAGAASGGARSAVMVMALGAAGCSGALPRPSGGGGAATESGDRMALPEIMLWAWERPEDLRALGALPSLPGAARVGVAPLVATLTLRGDEVEVGPRRQPLRLPEGVTLCPVVRIEADRAAPPRLDEAQRAQVVAALASVVERAGRDDIPRLQIDFEATASQRPFYRALLADLRARLGSRLPLSITALASWCLGDRWLADLPVDEVVPMMYRLGPRAAEAGELLARHGDFPARECRGALGLSLDEAPPLPSRFPPTPRRTFYFNPRPWSSERMASLAAAPPWGAAAAAAPEHAP